MQQQFIENKKNKRSITMIQKVLKVLLILVMIIMVGFSIMNLTTKSAQALMTEELLHEDGNPEDDIYVYWCSDPGQGCYTVIEQVQ
jgi:hypothetical protein